jgi:hypothetical protein
MMFHVPGIAKRIFLGIGSPTRTRAVLHEVQTARRGDALAAGGENKALEVDRSVMVPYFKGGSLNLAEAEPLLDVKYSSS